MKIAHLILAHKCPDQVYRLANKLQDAETDVYIHIDKKSHLLFTLFKLPANTILIKNTVSVTWAGYSMVSATLNGLKEILDSGTHYDHIHITSGQDYPIKSNSEIKELFEKNKGKLFVKYLPVGNEWPDGITRITQYHLTDINLPGKYKLQNLINFLAPKRKFLFNWKAVGKSQWITINTPAAKYIIDTLNKHPEIERFFKLSWAPDEIIFHTILYNSDYREHIINDDLTYMDWTKGGASPKVLGMDDKTTLQQSEALFARKFDVDVDKNILDYLDTITS